MIEIVKADELNKKSVIGIYQEIAEEYKDNAWIFDELELWNYEEWLYYGKFKSKTI